MSRSVVFVLSRNLHAGSRENESYRGVAQRDEKSNGRFHHAPRTLRINL